MPSYANARSRMLPAKTPKYFLSSSSLPLSSVTMITHSCYDNTTTRRVYFLNYIYILFYNNIIPEIALLLKIIFKTNLLKVTRKKITIISIGTWIQYHSLTLKLYLFAFIELKSASKSRNEQCY
jgi:hypothetical protein